MAQDASQTIHKAINDFDTESVLHMLQEPGLDLDEIYDGVTPLALAIEKENYGIVKLLIDAGANINAQSYSRQHCTMERPIVTAARVYDKNIFGLILAQGCYIDLGCDGHKDALHWAVTHGDLHMVQDLLKLGADVNWIGHSGHTALHYATRGGHIDIVNILLSRGAEITVNNEWRSPVHIACFHSQADVLKELLRFNPRVNIKDMYNHTPLSLASLGDHLNVLEELFPVLSSQVDSSELQSTLDYALSSSIRRTAIKSVTYLLQKGANPNTIGSMGLPLINEVCRTSKTKFGKHLLKLLTAHGARLDNISESQIIPLYYILLDIVDISYGDILLYHGADVIPQDLNKVGEANFQVETSRLEIVSETLRCRIGSMYHDATLWKLYYLSTQEYLPSPGLSEEMETLAERKKILHTLQLVPCLSALSRSRIRRRLAELNGCRTIAPLIHQLDMPNLPQGIIKYLLLADVIDATDL